EQIARVFAYVEDVMYVGLAALLALSALVLLGTTAMMLGRSVFGGALPSSIIVLLDQLLLVLLIVELSTRSTCRSASTCSPRRRSRGASERGGLGGPFEAPHLDQTKRAMICPPRIFM